MIAASGCTQFNADDTEESGPESTDDDEESAPEIEATFTISGPEGEESFFTVDDIESIGSVEDPDEQSAYVLPFQLTDEGTAKATDAFETVGAAETPEEASVTYTIEGDVEVEQTFGVAPGLAEAIATGEWDGTFQLRFEDREQAEDVHEALRKNPQ
ncbi:hypothetical protein AArcSl_1664 [Halalkaliarchaeum desulfuricum]|uniref:Uncharacterized protein n=1 Tax=Halalkaliarchaeum desulfuricum TaxID=2055893 RepID=A0A343TJM1_9EURY|nr:hypothetical protein AArcSl_1664 [Halalkaliarchaeum desulfuricum]